MATSIQEWSAMPIEDGLLPAYDHGMAVARKVIDRGSAVPCPSADEAA